MKLRLSRTFKKRMSHAEAIAFLDTKARERIIKKADGIPMNELRHAVLRNGIDADILSETLLRTVVTCTAVTLAGLGAGRLIGVPHASPIMADALVYGFTGLTAAGFTTYNGVVMVSGALLNWRKSSLAKKVAASRSSLRR